MGETEQPVVYVLGADPFSEGSEIPIRPRSYQPQATLQRSVHPIEHEYLRDIQLGIGVAMRVCAGAQAVIADSGRLPG